MAATRVRAADLPHGEQVGGQQRIGQAPLTAEHGDQQTDSEQQRKYDTHRVGTDRRRPNTVDDPGSPADFDHLGDVDRCLAWARHRGLLEPSAVDRQAAAETTPRSGRARADLLRLHRLRDSVQSGFTGIAHGQPFPEPEWREIRRAAAHAIAHAADAGHVGLHWPGDDLGAVVDAVAYAAYDLLTGDQLHQLKHCAGCHWLFLDRSKNGSRRWCSMQDCGTSTKMRRYVARRAARRSAATTPAPGALGPAAPSSRRNFGEPVDWGRSRS